MQARMKRLERTAARTPDDEGSRALRVESPLIVDQGKSVETTSESCVPSAYTSAFEPPLFRGPTTSDSLIPRVP